MHRRLAFLLLALLIALCANAPVSQAQQSTSAADPPTADPVRDEKARQLFSAGVAAYSEGHYENALENYRLAFELSDRPQLLFNIGIAAERLRRDQEALDAFNKYLERVPNADNRAFVEERIAVLRQAIDNAAAQPQVAAPAAALAPSPAPDQSDSGSVLSKWWFWGIVGVAAVAVTTTVVVVATAEPDYQRGDVGGVVTTLSWQ
jgi:tetratricopeptide (TPR) repeat protein